jgi:hypothetical protein
MPCFSVIMERVLILCCSPLIDFRSKYQGREACKPTYYIDQSPCHSQAYEDRQMSSSSRRRRPGG